MTRGFEISDRGFIAWLAPWGVVSGASLPLWPNHIQWGLLHYKAVPHRVLGDDARLDELEQVVGPSGLRSDARAAVAAERLPADHRAGDVAVHVQVADRRAPRHALDRRRRAGEQPAGERKRRRLHGVAGRIDARHALQRDQRAE